MTTRGIICSFTMAVANIDGVTLGRNMLVVGKTVVPADPQSRRVPQWLMFGMGVSFRAQARTQIKRGWRGVRA